MPVTTTAIALRGLRAGAAGAALAGVFWAVAAANVSLPFYAPRLSCDRTQDQYCLGTGFFSLLIGLVLVVLIIIVVVVLLGWGLLALFRVRRPLLVALAGPPIMFILAWLSSTVGVMVFRPSIVQVVAAFVAYALSALVLSRLA